jgi:FAD/FMN-containing dehydrogenase
MIDRRPALIARCAGASDVIRSVDFARTQGLLVSVRGGGHSFAGTSVYDDGLVIDLSSMRGIRIDQERRTARAEAGALWSDLDHESQMFGLATSHRNRSAVTRRRTRLVDGHARAHLRQCARGRCRDGRRSPAHRESEPEPVVRRFLCVLLWVIGALACGGSVCSEGRRRGDKDGRPG